MLAAGSDKCFGVGAVEGVFGNRPAPAVRVPPARWRGDVRGVSGVRGIAQDRLMIFSRCKEHGREVLNSRSRQPVRYATQLSRHLIVTLERDKPTGAPARSASAGPAALSGVSPASASNPTIACPGINPGGMPFASQRLSLPLGQNPRYRRTNPASLIVSRSRRGPSGSRCFCTPAR